MTLTQATCPNRITLCTSKKGAHPAVVGALTPVFEKSATELRLKQKFKKNQEIRSQWSKENQKTLRESCNATITKVLNTRQWSQL